MKSFRGATAVEIIVVRLDPGDEVRACLERAVSDLSLAAGLVISGSGTLDRITLENPATTSFPAAVYATEKSGPGQIVAAQGLVTDGSVTVTLTVARRGEVYVGSALDGCLVLHGAEFVILRAGGARWTFVPGVGLGLPEFEAAAPSAPVPNVMMMGRPVDPMAIALVPPALIRRHQALPVARAGDTLVVAMVDPNNPFAIDDIRAATGLRVQTVAVPPHELMPALEAILAGKTG